MKSEAAKSEDREGGGSAGHRGGGNGSSDQEKTGVGDRDGMGVPSVQGNVYANRTFKSEDNRAQTKMGRVMMGAGSERRV